MPVRSVISSSASASGHEPRSASISAFDVRVLERAEHREFALVLREVSGLDQDPEQAPEQPRVLAEHLRALGEGRREHALADRRRPAELRQRAQRERHAQRFELRQESVVSFESGARPQRWERPPCSLGERWRLDAARGGLFGDRRRSVAPADIVDALVEPALADP